MDKRVKVWYDKEADFREVIFEKKRDISGKPIMMR